MTAPVEWLKYIHIVESFNYIFSVWPFIGLGVGTVTPIAGQAVNRLAHLQTRPVIESTEPLHGLVHPVAFALTRHLQRI
jgi:hypothetical protein